MPIQVLFLRLWVRLWLFWDYLSRIILNPISVLNVSMGVINCKITLELNEMKVSDTLDRVYGGDGAALKSMRKSSKGKTVIHLNREMDGWKGGLQSGWINDSNKSKAQAIRDMMQSVARCINIRLGLED